MDGVGHMLTAEAPEAVAGVVLGWLHEQWGSVQ
jgi:hypothetical protein